MTEFNMFPGLIVDLENAHSFQVKKCPEKHAGEGRVLINYKKRNGARRFQVVRLMTEGGHTAYAAVVGHYENDDVIMMDYDLRTALNVKLGDRLTIEVKKCRILGLLRWYLTVPDPLIRVSAYLAVLSTGLGLLSIGLSLK